MTGPKRQYLREMSNYFGYLATWTPGSPLALGDVGRLDSGAFNRQTTLEDLGITFTARRDQTTEDIAYSSADGVSVTFKAAGTIAMPGSTIPQGKAGATIEFTRKTATLFEASGCAIDSINELATIGQDLIALHEGNKWDTRWIVVTELITASSGTVFISEGNSGKVEVVASGQVDAASFKLTDINLSLSISFYRDVTTRIVAQQGLTPLYRAFRVESFFGRRFKPVGPYLLATTSDAPAKPEFVEVRPSAFDVD